MLTLSPAFPASRDSHAPSTAAVIAATALQPPPKFTVEGVRDAQLSDTTMGLLLRGKEAGTKPSAEQLGGISRSFRRLLQPGTN